MDEEKRREFDEGENNTQAILDAGFVLTNDDGTIAEDDFDDDGFDGDPDEE